MLMTVLKNTRELFTLIKFIYSTNKIYKHIKKNNLISDKLIGKRVLINTVRTYIPQQIAAELYFALLLRANGASVQIIYDDNALMTHDTNHYEISRIKKFF